MKVRKKEKQMKNIFKDGESYYKAVLKLKTMTLNPCGNYDPFGLCTIPECMSCENSSFIIEFDSPNESYPNGIYKKGDYEKYENNEELFLIEFMEGIPVPEHIIEYLLKDESNYRITRVKDSVIMRRSNEGIDNQKGSSKKITRKRK